MPEINEWELETTNLGRAREVDYRVAVLPVGATEAHNLHLPYGTDTFQVQAIARQSCEMAWEHGAKVLLLPALPISVNENTLGFPWTLSLRPSTIYRCITDIVSSLEEHGIRQMVLLNGHGGNEFQPLLRELSRRTQVQIILVNWWTCATEAWSEIFDQPGEHGDEMETSLLLHLHPELVELDRADEGALREPLFTGMREGWAWMARPWHRLTTNSGVGNPERADADKGRRFLRAIVEKISGLLVEMSEATVDELYPYSE